ncbi:4Fe-4S ferredoxin [Candidatus Acidianus copahuensis]|uniref:4Fe-4S ferredoxin n=1 Tax=Candidatus Acidianus copahuensis TaxID=1160895 RepID=A0A031LPR2_9CREN|nr:4Fe-4S ferredoxin [Candidatus Acidianus copahuensis]EZQ06745.1 4Fe-4S ferredoxin [Candidatus Acidianus copahuensis]
MSPHQLAILVYIIGMMAIDLVIFYFSVKIEMTSKRGIFFLSSILLYMGVEAVDISLILFKNMSVYVEPISLLLASVPIILSTTVKDTRIEWRRNAQLSLLYALTVVVDELAMGYAFSLAFGPHLGNPIIDSVSNIAFGFMMMVDAIFFLIFSVRDIKEWALFTFAFSMAFLPNIYIDLSKFAEFYASIISNIIMVINIIMLYLMEIRSNISSRIQIISLTLAFFNLFMMVGLTGFSAFMNFYLISLSMLLSMVAYFLLTFYKIGERRITKTWKYLFSFLVLINATEIIMAFGETVLALILGMSGGIMKGMSTHIITHNDMPSINHMANSMQGIPHPFTGLWWLFPINPLSMTLSAYHSALISGELFAFFWSSFIAIMMATMTPYYVIMMGAEMAFLVYERFRTVKTGKVKTWTLIIILGIPLFVVYVPYYTSYYIFGMSGMIFPVTLLSFSISILIIVFASSLFGRRVYCNLTCMAAHMWTNAFYDQFKAKRSSKIWDYLRWLFLIPMIVAFTLYVLSDFHVWAQPVIAGKPLNPLDFYGMFTLNYVWWFFYFTTPVFGIYSCARQGWCGFGTFSGIFNKVLFKIRARDPSLCRNCKAHSCDDACPIKIPISSDVTKKGFSNRITCVGCGDCIEGCDNLEIIDISSYLHRNKGS